MREVERVDIGVDADLVDDVDIRGQRALSAFINAALAESSGKSPLSVMLLPLRAIESGAKDSFGHRTCSMAPLFAARRSAHWWSGLGRTHRSRSPRSAME